MKSKDIPMRSWSSNETAFYFIENVELREQLGVLIGEIARSHGENVDDLEGEFDSNRKVEVCPHWEIDPLKIALLLRVADAIHIDSRRAPSFVFALRNISEESKAHWKFQNLIQSPTVQGDKLVYSVRRPFESKEAEPWWLAYDMMQMADREIRKSNRLLKSLGKKAFCLDGIAGVESPRSFASKIKVKDWEPIDAKIKVSNVADLAKNLGGMQLYGRSGLVPLRELVQNACDAVRARRIEEERGEEWGIVTISHIVDGKDEYLEIKDDGIGMSTEVLTGPFLDFGASY